MSKKNFLLQITNSIWLIEPSAITDLGPIVRNVFEKNPSAFNEVKQAQVQIFDVSAGAVLPGYYSGFKDAPQGSIAIIDVCGVIMKEDNCGDPGTASLGLLTKQADSNPNIIATIFRIDSPGGSVAGTEEFSNIIKNTTKPTIGLVSGMMCSAAYWIGSACDELYISNKTDMVGSIGTMMSFADAQPMWEKQGVVFHEVYADASTDKNQESIQARQKNYDLVKQNILNPMNNVFLSAVKKNRGEKLDQEQTLSGKVFLGAKAIKAGLVDDIKTFEETVVRAQFLASQSTNNKNQSQTNMKIGAKFTAMIAFFAAQFPGFKAEETVLTEEHLTKMDAELATLAAVTTAKETAEAAVATLTQEKANAVSALATANATIENQKAEITRMSELNPGATTTGKEKTDDTGKSGVDEAQAIIDGLEHNKAVDANPMFNTKK